MRVSIDDRRYDPLDRAARFRHDALVALVGKLNAVGGQKRLVRLLRLFDGIAHRHVLVALDVEHCEHLHEPRVVLQGHEVRRLATDVDEQRERRVIAEVLHLALGRAHGRILRRSGHFVEVRLGGALVHQHETDDGVVGRGRSHAGVHPYVIVFGDVVVPKLTVGARRGLHDALLAKPRVDPTVLVGTVPVVLLHKQVGGIHAVDPLRHLFHRKIGAFARRRVAHDNALDGLAAEQADGTILNRADPPRLAVVVDLESELVEHVERVLELHMAIDVARERLRLRVADRVVAQAHDLGILRRHVDERVGRDALLAVCEPFEQVGVAQGAHTHGIALVVDLTVERRNFELAYVLGNRTHGAVTQKHRRITVDDGYLGVVDLLDILGELVVSGLEDARVLLGVTWEERKGGHRSHDTDEHDDHGQIRSDLERLRLLLVVLVAPGALLVGVGARREEQEQGQQNENRNEHPRIGGVDVDRRMEPPIRNRCHDEDGDDRDDDRLLPPCGEFIAERNLDARRPIASARRSPVRTVVGAFPGKRISPASHIDARLTQGFQQGIYT